MRTLCRSIALASAALLAVPAFSQMTPITAAHIQIGGVPVAAGKVFFTPVDITGTPITVSIGGAGGIEAYGAYAGKIVAGAIVGVLNPDGTTGGTYQVPDACLASPSNFLYTAQIVNTGVTPNVTLPAMVKIPNVCGSGFSLDAFAPPAIGSVTQIIQQSQGTTVPGSCVMPSTFAQIVSGALISYNLCVGTHYVQLAGATVTATGMQAAVSAQSGCGSGTNPWVPATDTCPVPPYLPLAGGTMTGPIVLPADPTTNLQAATKQYVDAHAGSGSFNGGTVTNQINAPAYGGTGSTQTVLNLTAGTAAATPPAHTIQIGAPTSVTSSYVISFPTTAPTDSGGDVLFCPPGGGTCTWQPLTGGGTISYINTIFNEASSGTALAGTTPTTCASGCVGPWTLASGTDFTYQSGGGVLASTTFNTNFDLITVGQTNYTLRFNASALTGAGLGQIVLRYTDANNQLILSMCTASANDCNESGIAGYAVFDLVGGTATQLGAAVATTPTGSYTVVLNGTAVSVTGPSGSISGTTANTGTKLGFAFRAGTSFGLSSLSAKSN